MQMGPQSAQLSTVSFMGAVPMMKSRASVRALTAVALLVASCADVGEESPTQAGQTRDAEVNAEERTRDSGRAIYQPPVQHSDWRPLQRDTVYEGKTLDEWVLEWAHWSLSQTNCDSPSVDDDGSFCLLYQDSTSPVFFFADGKYKTQRTRCRVPSGKAILVPLTQFISNPDEVPSDDWFTDAPPEERIRQVQNSMRDLKLRVDGFTVQELNDQSVGPLRFSHEFPAGKNYFSCMKRTFELEGRFEPLYIVGYFVLFPPPTVGSHILEYGGSLSYPNYDSVQQVSSTFIVE